MADKKTPQEASNIFHSIMKVTVSPKKVACPVCGWLGKPVPKEPGNISAKEDMNFQKKANGEIKAQESKK